MNVSDIASMLAALGSCAAALATWRTVTEMKRQREASWRPDIACIFPVLTTGEDVPCLRLRNVGFGVAKDVIVKLSIPLERIFPAVNEALRQANDAMENSMNGVTGGLDLSSFGL